MGIDPTRGFVAFPRGLTEWEWYTEPNTARLFFHLLLTANWQEKQWQGITIHPGELVTSQSQLAKQLGLSVRNVRTALEHLQVTGYLTVKTGSKYSVISINNYTSIVAGDRQSDRQVTGNRQATDNNLTIITNQQANKSSSAAQPTRTKTTTQPLVMEFENSIGKLNGKGKAELAEYADRLGNELVSAVIGRCADLGGRSWAYVRTALQEAEAGKYHSVEDYRKLKEAGIGTPATRAAIIETLFSRDYIRREKKSLVPTEKGLAVHSIVRDKKIADISMTGSWESALAKIETGGMDSDTFHRGIEVYTAQITTELLNATISIASATDSPVCPKCKQGHVLFFNKIAKCSNVDCTLKVFRGICNKQLTDKQITELVTKGKTGVIKGLQGKSGKSFDAALAFDAQFNVTFSFPTSKKSK